LPYTGVRTISTQSYCLYGKTKWLPVLLFCRRQETIRIQSMCTRARTCMPIRSSTEKRYTTVSWLSAEFARAKQKKIPTVIRPTTYFFGYSHGYCRQKLFDFVSGSFRRIYTNILYSYAHHCRSLAYAASALVTIYANDDRASRIGIPRLPDNMYNIILRIIYWYVSTVAVRTYYMHRRVISTCNGRHKWIHPQECELLSVITIVNTFVPRARLGRVPI